MGANNKTQNNELYYEAVHPRLNEISVWASQGITRSQIAGKLNIGTSTFYRYQKRYKELGDIFILKPINNDKESCVVETVSEHVKLINALRDMTINNDLLLSKTVEEIVFDKDGNRLGRKFRKINLNFSSKNQSDAVDEKLQSAIDALNQRMDKNDESRQALQREIEKLNESIIEKSNDGLKGEINLKISELITSFDEYTETLKNDTDAKLKPINKKLTNFSARIKDLEQIEDLSAEIADEFNDFYDG